MGHTNNREPRRLWSSERAHGRASCASCGAPMRHAPSRHPFCDACVEASRRSNLDEWDDLGVGD